MDKTGSCLCGAVRFTLGDVPGQTGACHCGMCRKFSGGVYLGVQVPGGKVTFQSDDTLARYASSAWAERGFCARCGSSLFYRVTAPGPHHDQHHFGLGSLDDTTGITLTQEIFIDRKPEGYAFAGDTHKMTEAEMMALFAPPES